MHLLVHFFKRHKCHSKIIWEAKNRFKEFLIEFIFRFLSNEAKKKQKDVMSPEIFKLTFCFSITFSVCEEHWWIQIIILPISCVKIHRQQITDESYRNVFISKHTCRCMYDCAKHFELFFNLILLLSCLMIVITCTEKKKCQN